MSCTTSTAATQALEGADGGRGGRRARHQGRLSHPPEAYVNKGFLSPAASLLPLTPPLYRFIFTSL